MEQKIYNLKMQILKDLSIKDDLKKDLAEQIFQIQNDLAKVDKENLRQMIETLDNEII